MLGCQSTVATGLAEDQANRVVVALDHRGIPATKEAEAGTSNGPATFAVQVASDDAARALTALGEAELPQRPLPGIAEVFGEGGLVPTPTEERARLSAAMAGELSRSLESVQGVLSARVHVGLPIGRTFSLDEEPPRPRASVLVKHRHGEAPIDANAIRALVVGAVPDMRPEDVAVVQVSAAAPEVESAAMVHIGPIAVSSGSAAPLRALLGSAFGLHILLVACLLFVVLRRRNLPGQGSPEIAT